MRYAAWWTWGCLLVGVASAGHGQARWVVEPTTSLAWWQMVPHLHHLWATTCPGEPSWRPGEGRSSGWAINPALELAESGYGLIDDTVHRSEERRVGKECRSRWSPYH